MLCRTLIMDAHNLGTSRLPAPRAASTSHFILYYNSTLSSTSIVIHISIIVVVTNHHNLCHRYPCQHYVHLHPHQHQNCHDYLLIWCAFQFRKCHVGSNASVDCCPYWSLNVIDVVIAILISIIIFPLLAMSMSRRSARAISSSSSSSSSSPGQSRPTGGKA